MSHSASLMPVKALSLKMPALLEHLDARPDNGDKAHLTTMWMPPKASMAVLTRSGPFSTEE
jgi:hypothetical protein